jgi:uncharacterized pyridoxamine 5'-phosphate oxidase family protein
MRKVSSMILFSFFLYFVSAQSKLYFKIIKVADSLYRIKDYQNSANTYSKAFEANNWKGLQTDRYNAACAWALTGNKDSAFSQLYRIAERSQYQNYNHIKQDQDLITLHTDSRWQPLMEIVRHNKDKAEQNLNKPMVAILDSIYNEDQGYRMQIDSITKQYGWESKEMKSHLRKMDISDSINLIKVKAILDQYGWVGSEIVGKQGNSTLFLVIQHADLQSQEKYLPMMRTAVKNNKASASQLALLEDRVALRQGKRQIYGSQIGMYPKTNKYYVSPLEDPENVDKRRAEVGLGPLKDYVDNWQIKWDVDQYKKELPKIEKLEKGRH